MDDELAEATRLIRELLLVVDNYSVWVEWADAKVSHGEEIEMQARGFLARHGIDGRYDSPILQALRIKEQERAREAAEERARLDYERAKRHYDGFKIR